MDSTYGPSYSKYGLTLPAGGYYQPPTYGRTLSTHGKFSGRQSTLLWQVPPPPSSVKSRGKICSITLAAASFVVLISVLAIAGLALYMGAVHSSPEPFVTFRGSAKVARGDRFIGNVQEKARRYSMQFEALYKKSNLGPAVVSSSVDRFGNDTYTVYFKIVLDKRKLPKTLVNVEKALKDILVTDPLSRKPTFGKIRFDSRSITFSASSADESYQRNSPPLKETPLTRNRVLLKPNNRLNLTTVRTTSTTKSPIKEIEINEETLPMIQGSFKISKTEADITENKKTAPKLFEMKTTTPSPKPKPTVKETAITSTLFKIAQSTTTTTSTPTTTKETPTTTKTTPTTPSTTTAASTTSTSTSTLTSTSTSSSYFDQEPWIPIIDHKQQQFYNFFPHNNKNKQSFYTSFTNPDLSYTGGSAEILGATMPQRHPLPVNKLADVPDDSRWETSTMQVNYNINIKHEKFGNNNNNNNNNDKIIVVSSTTSTTTSPPNTQSSTLSIDDQSEKIKEKINALDYKTRQDAILKNVSTIFHGLLSSLGIESSFNSNNQQTIQHQQQLPKVQDQQKLDVNKNQNLNQSLEEKLETPVSQPVLNEQPTQSNLTLKLKLNETNQHSLDNPGKQTTIVELTDSNKKEEIVYEKVTLTPTKGPRVDDEITKGPVFDEKLKRKGEEIAFEELSRQGSDSLPSLPILQETDKVIETEEVIGEGQVEVVNEDSIFIPEHTTKQSLVTLLPAKSNSGVGKPLRPRPKIPGRSNSTIPVIAENRSFPSDSSYKNLNTNFDLKENKEFTISSLHSSGIPGVAIVENSEEIMNVNGENDKKKNTNFNIVGVLNFQPGPEASVFQDDVSKNGIIRVPKMEEPGINQTDIKIKINNKDEEDDDDNDEDEISVFSTSSSVSLSIHRPLTPEKIKQLAEISKISENFTDGREISNNKLYNYTMSNGFKVLTKNFNKVEVVKTLDKPVKLGCNKTDCSGFTVRCGDGKLFPETTRCNQLVDCADGSDEQNCTCADYLRSQFLLRKICDGIVDCWDFSDENNCEWCKPGQYVCGNSKVCIDHNQICDGNKDCPHGDDERLCVTIAPAIEEAEGFSYYSEGYLMVQRKGKWGKLCADNFQDPAPAWNVAELGRVVCKSMTYRTLTRTETVLEEQVGQRSQYYQLERVNGTNSELAFEETACETAKVVKVKCKTLECGARPQAVDQVARIVGGGNAGLGAWPWQAAIYKEGEFQCGGTLISDQWLLSAGHCFYHSLEDHWVARLGALRRGTSLPSPYEQLRIITNIILHPNYNDVGFVNDISLLKMEKPIAFSDYVRPICLPPADSKLKDGRVCTVIGWGQLFEVGRIFPDTLQEVQVPVISTAECRKMTIFMPLYKVTDDMFCAGFERGGRDACLGDSGGPLMCPEDDGQWVLQGITSNGYGCARANRPGVYTKVSNYIPWIETLLYDNSANTTHHQRSPKPCNGHRCPLGECLPKSSVCNGFIECNDGSDEKDCLINN